MAYQELLDQLQALTPEQLKTEIKIGSESGSYSEINVWVAPCDQVNPSGESLEDITHYPESERAEMQVVLKANEVLLILD